jgi:hypothetical protein
MKMRILSVDDEPDVTLTLKTIQEATGLFHSPSSPNSSSKQQKLPMTGTTDQIGTDIDQSKAMGVEYIIFGQCLFSNRQGYEEDNRDNKTAC